MLLENDWIKWKGMVPECLKYSDNNEYAQKRLKENKQTMRWSCLRLCVRLCAMLPADKN